MISVVCQGYPLTNDQDHERRSVARRAGLVDLGLDAGIIWSVPVQAIPSGDANSVFALIVGANFALERISLPGPAGGGAPLATGPAHWSVQPDFLSSDGSRRHLLVGLDNGETFGRIGRGSSRRLPEMNALLTSAAW